MRIHRARPRGIVFSDVEQDLRSRCVGHQPCQLAAALRLEGKISREDMDIGAQRPAQVAGSNLNLDASSSGYVIAVREPLPALGRACSVPPVRQFACSPRRSNWSMCCRPRARLAGPRERCVAPLSAGDKVTRGSHLVNVRFRPKADIAPPQRRRR